MEATAWLFLLNPKIYQNDTWENTSVSYNKQVFDSTFADWIYVLDLYIILIKSQCNKNCKFLVININQF